MWRSYAVQAWPTLVAIDPRGYVVGMHAGEFLADDLASFIDGVLEKVPATLPPHAEGSGAEPPSRPPSLLKYPGKVAVEGDLLAIADGGHARVVLVRLDADGAHGKVERIVDGFVSPQGMCFSGNRLYVADAGTHSTS